MSIDWQISQYKRRKRAEAALARNTEASRKRSSQVEGARNACEFVHTGNPNSVKPIVVRCRCMAPYRSSPRNFNYEPIGLAATLPEAVAMWRDHVNGTPLAEASP